MLSSKAFPICCAVLLGAAALSGCNRTPNTTAANSNGAMAALAMPLTTGPETPVTPAPPAAALPPSHAAMRVARVTRPEDNYAYVDRAYAMSDAFGDAPPDYGYDYGPTHVWAWRGGDNSVRLVEPVDGGQRYYYYRPGQNAPYLVRDIDNSYGYDDNGELVVVYDRAGRPMPYTDRYADRAGRELARARNVYAASLSSERRQVRAANWAARRAEIDAARADWAAQQSREAAWRAYHDAHATEQTAYWQDEQARRAREAQIFDDWQRRDYAGAMPVAISDPRQGSPADRSRRQQLALAEQRRRDQIVTQARLDQQRTDLQARQHQQQATQQKALAEQHQRDEAVAKVRLDQQRADFQARQHQQQALDAQRARQQAEFQAHQQQAEASATQRAASAQQLQATRQQAAAEQKAHHNPPPHPQAHGPGDGHGHGQGHQPHKPGDRGDHHDQQR